MPRGITEDELWILTHNMMFGSAMYPVRKLGRKWTWGPIRSVQGPPTMFPTKRAATENFEAYLGILRDAKAGRI